MAQCVQCGRELPSLGHDESQSTCADCQLQSAQPGEVVARRQLPAPVVTIALIGICVAVFGIMLASGVSATAPTTIDLRRWGADFGPLTLAGQWWRIVTSAFVHIGVFHLALNMWCLWDLGQLAERVFGRTMFLALYLLAAIAGAVASLAWHPYTTSAGASGAIFGVAGALIAIFYLGEWPGPRSALRSTLRSLVVFAGYNLFIGAVNSRIDNSAHIGGLVCGLLLGALVARARSDVAFHRLAFIAVAALLAVAGVLVLHMQAYTAHVFHGSEALDSGRLDVAIRELMQAASERPKSVQVHSLLGEAYGRKDDYPHAEAEFRQVVQLDPEADEARYHLALALILQKRAPEAETELRILQQRDPRSADVQTGLGLAYALQSRDGEALAAYKRAVELDPKSARSYHNMGLVYMRLKRYDEAVAAFLQSARLAPGDAETQLGLGEAYKAQGRMAEAQAAFVKAAELQKPK